MEKMTFLLEGHGEPTIEMSHVLGDKAVEIRTDKLSVRIPLSTLAMYSGKLWDMEQTYQEIRSGLKGR